MAESVHYAGMATNTGEETMSHTPGPWHSDGSYVASERGTVARAYAEGCAAKTAASRAQEAANASLIAAAPDLLAACKHALMLLDNPHAGEPIRAAIAKAEGK